MLVSKTFTVTNSGEDTDYVVVIDGDNNRENGITPINVTYAETSGTQVKGASTSFVSNDFRYTITCTVNGEACNGIENEVFPLNGGIAVGNVIKKGEVHEYTLTMEYIETNVNQSADMNKTFNAVVNIEDIRRINPYSENESSLAYNIINNSILKTNGTKLLATPPSNVAEEQSLNDWSDGTEDYVYLNDNVKYKYASTTSELWMCWDSFECDTVKEYKGCTSDVEKKYVMDDSNSFPEYYYVEKCENGKAVLGTYKFEKVLSTTQDDYGTSYYYRGNVKDNYVTFSNMCWRIVLIARDGSTKLILEDQYTTCDDNETNITSAVYTGDWVIDFGSYSNVQFNEYQYLVNRTCFIAFGPNESGVDFSLPNPIIKTLSVFTKFSFVIYSFNSCV